MGKGSNRRSQKMIQRRGRVRKKARLKKLVETKKTARRTARQSHTSKVVTKE